MRETASGVISKRVAMSVPRKPSALRSTTRARLTKPAGADDLATIASNSARLFGVNLIKPSGLMMSELNRDFLDSISNAVH
jgi:hypothetical protein